MRRIMDFGGKFLTVALFMQSWPGDLFFFSFFNNRKDFSG